MGGEDGGPLAVDYSSSGEEDGDEEWRAAIYSVVGGGPSSNGGGVASFSGRSSDPALPFRDNGHGRAQRQPLKHYQIKAQKALFEVLEKTLVFVREDTKPMIEDSVPSEGGVRLFKHSPLGIVFDHRDELQGPKKKPRIVPGDEVDEKSKKFRLRVQSVAVEGTDVLAAAEEARKKAQARLEAREEAAKEASKREEQRVVELKRVRGERWLPCIAREMQRKKT